jgi:hypothetical protein
MGITGIEIRAHVTELPTVTIFLTPWPTWLSVTGNRYQSTWTVEAIVRIHITQ